MFFQITPIIFEVLIVLILLIVAIQKKRAFAYCFAFTFLVYLWYDLANFAGSSLNDNFTYIAFFLAIVSAFFGAILAYFENDFRVSLKEKKSKKN